MPGKGIATVMVAGLGYVTEHFRLEGHDVVHASVPHVDPQVRAVAPVWIPHLAPAPLCGLGRPGARRTVVARTSGQLCRACTDHLRDLDEWVRQAEQELGDTPRTASGHEIPAGSAVANRIHAMPF